MTASRPELTHRHSSVLRTAVLGLLAVDGVLSAIIGALLLGIRIGSVPFPIGAVISGLLNAALVWAGLQWTSSPRLGAITLWVWLLTIGALTLGGPGGDIVFGGHASNPQGTPNPQVWLAGAASLASTFDDYQLLVLLFIGVLPPALVLGRHTRRD